MIRVASFDIFDTCLTRTFAYPTDLFAEVGEISAREGWIAISPREFSARRIGAELTARNLVASREISLDQIYRQLGIDLGLTADLVAKIRNAELHIEGESLLPIRGTRERILEARRQGRQILFLSDMYLPTSFLEGLLRKHDFFLEGDILHVSGEIGRHKGDGGLFKHARASLNSNVTEWLHFGDNPHADVVAPRRLGIEAEHFESGLLNRYERQVCPGMRIRHKIKARVLRMTGLDRIVKSARHVRPGNLREKWQSRLVAAMRLARLSKPGALSPQGKIIWNTGANVAGPLFYGYVKWVLAQAADKKLPRLYFIARDGQILLKIAETISAFRKSPVECRYLYGSRHAWLPASLREVDADQLRWILAPTAGLNLRGIFSRLEITPEKHRPLLESSGYPEKTWSQALTAAQLVKAATLFRDPSLSAEIKSVAQTKRGELLDYLRREGVFDQPEVGIVDLGWHGSLKWALSQVCEQAPDGFKTKIFGFYFALVRTPHQADESFLAYVNSLNPEALGGFLFYMQLLEAFAVADHGQTRGYRNGQLILDRSDNPKPSEWGLQALQGGILAYCQAFGALDDCTYSPESYLAATLPAMQLFYENPTRDEVKAWGSFPFSDQQVETELNSLLPPWNRGQALAALMTKDGRKALSWAPALAKREGMAPLLLYYRLQKLWRTRLKPKAK